MVPPDSPLGGYVSDNRRLYAQLRPDTASLAHLTGLQQVLAVLPGSHDGGRPRWIPERRIHLTLIHFGQVRDVCAAISAVCSVSPDDYERLLAGYVAATEAAMPRQPVVLEPAVLSRFGRHGRTLVLEYFPSALLLAAHAAAYAALKDFLLGCGIPDADAFTAADSNFMFAARLRPHITLARGFTGILPPLQRPALQGSASGAPPGPHYGSQSGGSVSGAGSIVLEPVRLEAMPVVYTEPG